jgi:signal transduction histidine kinase
LVEDGRTIGFLVTFSEQPGFFRSEITSFLLTFAAYAAVALHHAGVYQSELRARQAVETLSAASLRLTQTLELQTVLDVLLAYLHRLIPYARGWVALLESESRLVVCAHARHDHAGETEPMLAAVLDLADHPQLDSLLSSQQGVLAQNRAEAPPWTSSLATGDEQSWLAIPIVAGGRALGICSLAESEPNFFTPEQMHLAEAVAGQAAIAVQNAWLFQQLRAGRERLQSLSHRLVAVQENERLYVARELHDEAGQALASLMLGLGQLERDAQDPAKVAAEVHALKQVANGVQENLHSLAMDLRPASLDHLGLAAALQAFVEKLGGQCSATMQFKLVGWSEEREAPEVEVSLYRIAQEALANAVRHAQATHIAVLLQRNDSGVILTVEDNGIGFEPEAATSSSQMGLVGMRERCEMLGGSLVVESKPGAGTTVVAEVPHANPNSDLRRS